MIPYSGPIVTREAARAAGLKRFFTGVPCGRLHAAQRHVSSGECVMCRKAQKDRDYAKNRERYLSKCQQWHEKNKKYVKDYESARRNHINEIRRARDRNKSNAARRKRNAINGVKLVSIGRLHYDRHRDNIREKQSAYYKRKSGEFKARSRNRRARKRAAKGRHTALDIADIRKMQRDRCAEPSCRCNLHGKGHVDHIIPLVRGGDNDRRNLQLLCSICNHRKGAKDPIEFARELGRLL